MTSYRAADPGELQDPAAVEYVARRWKIVRIANKDNGQ